MKIDNPTTNELIALHLRYGQGAEPLRVRAYAQMVAKVLYTSVGNANTVQAIAVDVANALGSPRVSRKQIAQALNFLAEQGHTTESKSTWLLTDLGNATIESDLARAALRIDNVLQRHFPPRIEQGQLRSWFIDACVAFFQGFGDRWVSAICGGVPLKASMSEHFEDLLKGTIKNHKLEIETELLVRSFRLFITSTLPEDAEQLWSFGQAMFAARLVAVNISGDPITLKEIRGSTILLDTNVLFVAALEKHRLADSLSALGKAFNQLGVRLQFLNSSKEEYLRIVDYNSKMITTVVARYGREVLGKSYNNFLATAIARGCTDPEHFQTFFDAIKDPPSSIDDSQAITVLDYPELDEATTKGSQDESLKEKIAKAWSNARHRDKKPKAVEHDAALIYAARFLRGQKEKCWVLTLDRTLHEYDLRHTHPKDYPLLLSFDVLIQILGLEEAGPGFDPTVFAPIMSSIIAYQLEPALGTYAIEDLAWLLEVEERCADLPPAAVEDLAIEINNARLSGKSKDDPELRLRIQRVFQAQKLSLAGDLESARQVIRNKEDQLHEALQKRKVVEEAYTSTKRKHLRAAARRKLIKSLFLHLAAGLLLAIGALYLTSNLVSGDQPATFWALLLTALSPVYTIVFRIVHNIVPRYREELTTIESVLPLELQRLLENNQN